MHLRPFVLTSAAVVVTPGASAITLMVVATVTADMTIVLPGSLRVNVTPPLMVAMLALIIIGIHLIGTFNATHVNVLVMPWFCVICSRRPCSSQNI